MLDSIAEPLDPDKTRAWLGQLYQPSGSPESRVMPVGKMITQFCI
jgi:hypothetical protein